MNVNENLSYFEDMEAADKFVRRLPISCSGLADKIPLEGKRILLAGIGTSGGAAMLAAEMLAAKGGNAVRCVTNRFIGSDDGMFDIGIVMTSSGSHANIAALINSMKPQVENLIVFSGIFSKNLSSYLKAEGVVYASPYDVIRIPGAFCPVTRIVSLLCPVFDVLGLGGQTLLRQIWSEVVDWSKTDEAVAIQRRMSRPLVLVWFDSGKAAAYDLATRLHELGRYDVLLMEPLAFAHGQYKIVGEDVVCLFFGDKDSPAMCMLQSVLPAQNAVFLSPSLRGVAGSLELYFKTLHLVAAAFSRSPVNLQWSDAPVWGTRLYHDLGATLLNHRSISQ